MTGGSIGNLITMEEQESATHVIKDEHPRSKCQEFQKVQVFRKDGRQHAPAGDPKKIGDHATEFAQFLAVCSASLLAEKLHMSSLLMS
jgi:hypothetical protein